jgi:hypothetical protein
MGTTASVSYDCQNGNSRRSVWSRPRERCVQHPMNHEEEHS